MYVQNKYAPSPSTIDNISIANVLCFSGRRVKVTNQMFSTYHMSIRGMGFNALHRGGRLFQEYCVDKFAQIEQDRLGFLKKNQSQIRAELYQGLQDVAADGSNLSNIGTRIVLPSSFSSGPRQIWQLYYDAMALVRYCGKPDLFITMTANPKWPEITSGLKLPVHCFQDRLRRIDRIWSQESFD